MDLLERERQLIDLQEWLDAAAARHGLIAFVDGEAGIGKTALLQEFARRQRCAPRVLWGACDALFTPRPLAPLHDVARQTQGALLAAVAAGDRDAVFNAALDELERVPGTLVVLEDLHWADEATIDLLKFLGRRIQATRALVVVTYRDDEVGARHPLRFAIGDVPRGNVQRLHLASLSAAAVADLAARAGRSAAGLHRATCGNPFFLTEVLATAGDAVPATVRDAVLARAMRLSPAARAIAELVSVVPGRAEPWLFGQTATEDPAGVDGCLAIGMQRGADGSLAFRHELARRALEDALSDGERRALHARVLTTLMQQPDVPPARLAHHADGARNTVEVRRFAPLAATQAAAVGAHREAVAHYRLALRYAGGQAPDERARLHEQLSYECYLTDQTEAAIEARLAALELWRATGARLREGDALRWLSRLNWFAGRRAEADRYAVEAVAVLEALPAGPELAMAYSNRAQLEMLADRSAAAIGWAQRTIELAAAGGHEEILCHALNNLGTSRLGVLDEGGWADLERSLAIALARGFQEHAARAYTNLSSRAADLRRYATALSHLDAGIAYCEALDLESWRLYMLAHRARARFELGAWNEAAADAEAVLLHPRTAAISRIPALTVLARLRIRRGDPDTDSPLDEAWALAEGTREVQRLAPLACARAEAAWLAGDWDRLVEDLRPMHELAQGGCDPWLRGAIACWLWRADALDAAPDLPAPYALELSGDWRGAAAAWLALGCAYEQAVVLALHGDERDQLAALDVMVRLGANAAANALRRELRGRGVRRIPRGSRASTRRDPHGLTRREAEVLELLGEGLRNSTIAARLFVSTRTVDHHVSAILAKLGVPSRAEAIAMARRNRSAGG